jgi:hypothetical protein
LPDAGEIGKEAHHIATARSIDCEVSPSTCPEVDAEGSQVMVNAVGIEGDELRTLSAPAGEPSCEQSWQDRHSRSIYRSDVEAIEPGFGFRMAAHHCYRRWCRR